MEQDSVSVLYGSSRSLMLDLCTPCTLVTIQVPISDVSYITCTYHQQQHKLVVGVFCRILGNHSQLVVHAVNNSYKLMKLTSCCPTLTPITSQLS